MEGSVATYSFFSLGLFSFKTNCLGLWRLRSWENGFSMMQRQERADGALTRS